MPFTRCQFLQIAAAALILLFAPSRVAGESWSFAVVPDTQWGNQDAPFHGTAIHIIDAINAELVRQKVDFVIQVGDIVQSASAISFQTRAAHNEALKQTGIKYYPVRGNHDHARSLEAPAQFKEAFPGLPGTPGAGGSSPDLPGTAGMTYSFTHKGGKFILLDIYPLFDDGSETGKAYTFGDYLPWIESELVKDDHRFALVFSHQNLLGQKHKDSVFSRFSTDRSDQDSFPELQNAFLATLQRYHVRYFLCGHDHMYHRSEVKSPDGKSKVTQIICGSASHKFYTPVPPFLARETPIAQELDRVGFLIVRVDDERVQFEYYSTRRFGDEPRTPTWALRDTFGLLFDGNKEFGKPTRKMRQFVRSGSSNR